LVYLAVQLRQGKNWARVALAVLYGGVGTLSLVIGPVTWLAEGGSLADAVAAADLRSVLFAASRVVHLGAVIAALILMFHPAASAYIRTTTRAAARRGTQQEGEGGAAR
jgi:surface antigen